VAKLRRGIEGGVDRWSAHHGLEVGDGQAQRGGVVGRWRRSASSRRKKGPWAGWAAWVAQAR
jgi:hypothetical protein